MIFAITNQKGGVGKSTTTHALGAGLFYKKFRVLFVDLDPQGNLSYAMKADTINNLSSYNLLTSQAQITEILQRTSIGDIIPASPLLSRADIELDTVGKEYKLKEALDSIRNNYDFILIDTPPALSILTVNALVAADDIIIPAQADIFSLQGIGQLYNTIETVKKYCNPSLKIKGILLTRHNNRTILSRDLTDTMSQTAAQLKSKIFKAVIRENISLKEAQANQQDIFAYEPNSNAAYDYNKFINELLESEVI
jgi:chromosome partitioning protein